MVDMNMGNGISAQQAERVRRLVEEDGPSEAEAIFAVELADGMHKGDIVGLSDDERAAWGLDHPIVDLLPTPVPAE